MNQPYFTFACRVGSYLGDRPRAKIYGLDGYGVCEEYSRDELGGRFCLPNSLGHDVTTQTFSPQGGEMLMDVGRSMRWV